MTQNLSLDGRFERVSKPRYWWWGSIQAALRAYPRLKQRYEMPDVALTARYADGVGHECPGANDGDGGITALVRRGLQGLPGD